MINPVKRVENFHKRIIKLMKLHDIEYDEAFDIALNERCVY